MTDYYKTLGVDKSASQDDIKKAFRKKAHEHHPDKGNGNEAKFKEVSEAYQTLKDENKRRQYDQFGSSQAGGFGGQQGGQAGGFNQGNVHFDFGNMGDLGDMFGSFFGGSAQGGQGRRQTQRGSDIEVILEIDFKESVFGVEKTLSLKKRVVCGKCKGDGAEPGSKVTTCKSCGGKGKTTKVQQTILGNFQTEAICSDCHGEGKKVDQKCTNCGGDGVEQGEEKIKVKIPAGIEYGQSIRLSGKGEPSPKGMAGDLYLKIKVKKDARFERAGDDVNGQYHLSIKQAVLGDKIQVETVDGEVTLKIPEGTQSHTKFRLRDHGVPHLRARGRGDHIVQVIIDIPKKVSKGQKKALEEF